MNIELFMLKKEFNIIYQNMIEDLNNNDSFFNILHFRTYTTKMFNVLDNIINMENTTENQERKEIIGRRINYDSRETIKDSIKNLVSYKEVLILEEKIKYIENLPKYHNINDAKFELETLEKDTKKNYEIFVKSNEYLVADSIIWEQLSRLGYELVNENDTIETKTIIKPLNFSKKEAEVYEEYLDENGNIKHRTKKIMIPTGCITNNIIIKQRNYNGDYGKGSIFTYNTYLEINDNINFFKGSIKIELSFCIDDKIGGNDLAKITNEIPIYFNEEQFKYIYNIINVIKSNQDYKYNETHYTKEGFDFKKLRYYDVIIDNEEFEIPTDDKNIIELLNIFEYKKVSEYINLNYKNILGK